MLKGYVFLSITWWREIIKSYIVMQANKPRLLVVFYTLPEVIDNDTVGMHISSCNVSNLTSYIRDEFRREGVQLDFVCSEGSTTK